jgi:hypothetical protein
MGELFVSLDSPWVRCDPPSRVGGTFDLKVINIAIFVVTDTFSKWIAIITRKLYCFRDSPIKPKEKSTNNYCKTQNLVGVWFPNPETASLGDQSPP